MTMFQIKGTAAVFAATAVLVLSGCASTLNTAGDSEFACDGKTNNCPTPLEVYGATHNSPESVRNGRTPDQWKTGQSDANGKIKSSSKLLVAAEPPAMPIRQASQVMRIWVAPWVDGNDNLNWASYVYTEVTPKRWSFGEQEVRHQGMPAPFIPR